MIIDGILGDVKILTLLFNGPICEINNIVILFEFHEKKNTSELM